MSIISKGILNNIISFLTSPFSKSILPKTLALAAMIGLYQIVSWQIIKASNYAIYFQLFMWVYKISEMLIFSWILMLPYKYLGKIRLPYYWIILFIFAIFTLLDVFFLNIQKTLFPVYYFEILIGTNGNEASEFFRTFVNWGLIFQAFIALVLPLIVYLLTSLIIKQFKNIRFSKWVIALILCIVAPTYIYGNVFKGLHKVQGCVPLNIYGNRGKIDIGGSLERSYPKIVNKYDTDYDNICIIIGESYCRDNASLYGYSLPTTPNMEQLRADSLLFVFKNAKSVAINTSRVFKSLLCTAPEGDPDWYRKPSLIEVGQLSGNRVSWLSNQNQSGIFDNIQTRVAEIADTLVFTTQNKFTALYEDNHFDGELVPLLHNLIVDNDSVKNLYFIHLMGSHTDFQRRFPESFNTFTPDSYLQFPENQRQTRADYDNSLQYNDYVVSNLIKQFDGTKTLVIYFSDHAIDLFATDAEFHGHGKPSNNESFEISRIIPFVIYMTPEYQQANPDIVDAVRWHTNDAFVTKNLIYTVMDIMGLEFEGNENGKVSERSILKIHH